MSVPTGNGAVTSVTLGETALLNLAARNAEVGVWALRRVNAVSVMREQGGFRISFPKRADALSFLGAFLPESLAAIVRPIAQSVGDYAEVTERDGAVLVTIRYVGDAGYCTDRQPHDQTWEDFALFSETAQEAGFNVEFVGSDHDTIEATLRPATSMPHVARKEPSSPTP